MRKLFSIAALCGLFAHAPALAADMRMDDIVISANKIESFASEAASSVSVITAEDMEARQSRTLMDALKAEPGVFMGNAQGPAGVNTLMIRGSKSRYTQIRFNGIPLREAGAIEGNYDALLGSLQLAPGSVSRIEVLKGAQGSLYGSSAAGGVVSIYSGGRWDSGFSASLDLSGGSYGTFTASGRIASGDDRYYVDFVPMFTRSDGHERLWYEQGGFLLGAGLRLSEKTSLELTSLVRTFEGASFDAPFYSGGQWSKLVRYGDDKKTSGHVMLHGLTLTHEASDIWTVQGRAALTKSERKYRHYGTEYLGDTAYLELLNTLKPLENLTIVAGTEYEAQQMELESYGVKAQEQNAGAFSAYAKGILSFLGRKLVLNAGGRFSKHEDFESKATWDAGLSYAFDTGTRLFGNVATGFYAPSLYQRYGDGSWVKGNPGLEPESSVSYEFGVEQALWDDRLVLNAAVFTTEYEDQVAYDVARQAYYNADEAKVRGFELGFSVQPGELMRIDLGWTHVSAKQKTAGGTWEHSFQMPDDRITGTVCLFPLDRLKLSLTGRWEDERKDASGTVMDDAFFTLDAAASYEVSDHMQVYAKVSNLLDEDYAVYGWDMPGIHAVAGVRFTF